MTRMGRCIWFGRLVDMSVVGGIEDLRRGVRGACGAERLPKGSWRVVEVVGRQELKVSFFVLSTNPGTSHAIAPVHS